MKLERVTSTFLSLYRRRILEKKDNQTGGKQSQSMHA